MEKQKNKTGKRLNIPFLLSLSMGLFIGLHAILRRAKRG